MNSNKNNNNTEKINVFNEKAPCKTCIWALLTGYSKFYCRNYEQKPRRVYFEGKECPSYQKTDLEVKR